MWWWCLVFIILPLFHLLQRLRFPRVEYFIAVEQQLWFVPFVLEAGGLHVTRHKTQLCHSLMLFVGGLYDVCTEHQYD